MHKANVRHRCSHDSAEDPCMTWREAETRKGVPQLSLSWHDLASQARPYRPRYATPSWRTFPSPQWASKKAEAITKNQVMALLPRPLKIKFASEHLCAESSEGVKSNLNSTIPSKMLLLTLVRYEVRGEGAVPYSYALMEILTSARRNKNTYPVKKHRGKIKSECNTSAADAHGFFLHDLPTSGQLTRPPRCKYDVSVSVQCAISTHRTLFSAPLSSYISGIE
ncbi:hypothetical protein J3E68DRAFT_360747 [Trichoderma sp. SZMC 28012]